VIIEGEEFVKLTTALGITFEKADGTTDDLAGGTILNMTPGGSVLVNVKSGTEIIGTVKVTMSRYYKLLANPSSQTVNTYPIEGNIVLPFDHPTGNGWGAGVLAVVAGKSGNETPSQNELISGGLGSLFQYSISSQPPTGGLAASLEYSESLGCYVINNIEGKTLIEITVKYMGIDLGTINLTDFGTAWSLTVTNP
jgi:hypothetical protein